jgi:dCTP deaminase
VSVLSAQSIRELCVGPQSLVNKPLISPFTERGTTFGRSYGLSGCSYDVRVAQSFWLWPFWGRLASTIERFKIPNNICATVKDKSSNARRFILVQNTFIDSGWEGWLTLEITRFLPWPVYIKAGTPIAQIVFSWLDDETSQPYANGKYQNQKNHPQKAIDEN